MTVLIDGYWCESIVASPDAAQEWLLGGHRTASPDEALSWLLRHAEDLAAALGAEDAEDSPSPAGTPHDTPARVANMFRDWSDDTRYHQTQLDALDSGQHISINVRCWDRIFGRGTVELFYRLSARPVRVRFGADRRVRDVLPGGVEATEKGHEDGVRFLGTSDVPSRYPGPFHHRTAS